MVRWKRQHDAEQARERERARRQLVADLRRRRAAGGRLRDIAAECAVSYSVAQRATAGMASHRSGRGARRFTDDEMFAALRASRALSVYQYDAWHYWADGVQPSSAAIIARFGTWAAAVGAASR